MFNLKSPNTQGFVIPGPLPTLNEYINAERTNRYIAANMKKDTTYVCSLYARRLQTIEKPAHYTFRWYVPSQRVDPDNIAFAAKFIFDGLQEAGKLANDNYKSVLSLSHYFEVDKSAPRVHVEIVQIEGSKIDIAQLAIKT